MATNDRTQIAVQAMRVELDRYVSAADRDLARQWSASWQEIVDEFQAAARELTEMAEHGEWPTRTQVYRSQRAQNALKAAAEAIGELSKRAGVTITKDLRLVTASAEHWQDRVVQTQLPEHTTSVALRWDRVSVDALDAIVHRTTRRVESLTRPLSPDVQARMKSVLIRGVAVGDNPKAAARQIVQRCGQAFDGGLARARNIARTEILDAHREAARRARKANSDVLKGWRWQCTLSDRTCPSCLAQNGTVHPLDQPGPLDHQQGRCTAVPVTKTWRDLGIDLDEPEPTFPDARSWFDDQSEQTKVKIMGRERLDRYQRGDLTWEQMSQRRSTAGWRDSFGVAPL